MFKVGDVVELRDMEGVGYRYGQGEVAIGEQGVVAEIITTFCRIEYTINFPSFSRWVGIEEELILISSNPKFKLKHTNFPTCCTMNVIFNFGGTHVAMFNKEIKKCDILNALKEQVERARKEGLAILVATTNDQQKEANAALREFGFEHSKWANKLLHQETKVRLWYYYVEG